MENKILNRVKKMMALANDAAASEGERDNALRMAYNLLAKYNLTIQDVEAHGAEAADPRDEYRSEGWSQTWAKNLYGVIGDLFFCEYYYGGRINATKCRHYFVGKESNATTARLMSEYLITSILKEARSRYVHNLSPESRAFAVGATSKLRERARALREQQEAETTKSTGTALAIVNLYEAEEKANALVIAKEHPDMEVITPRTKDVKAGAFEAGRRYGSGLSLAPQVGASTSKTKLLK